MKPAQRYGIILGILRKNTFMLRDDFFRAAMKHFELVERGETVLQMNLNSLAKKKLIRVDKVGSGTRSRIVSIALTEKGLFENARIQMVSIAKEARIDMPPAKEKLKKVKPMPCGQVMTRCYMSGCYHELKCPLKQQEKAL